MTRLSVCLKAAWLAVGGILFFWLTLAPAALAADENILRLGTQKSSSILILLKHQGRLEKALAPLGVKVVWEEFTYGMPMIEAARAGQIDLTADLSDTMALFAAASDSNLTFFLQENPSPAAIGLVAPEDSPIKAVSDLKGRTIGVTNGAGGHYLTLAALAQAGLVYGQDVKIAFLPPADCRSAFVSGAIDAWAAYDPFLSAITIQAEARTIIDGTGVGADYRRFYLASSEYLHKHPEVMNVVFEEIRKTGEWIKGNPDEAARLHAEALGFDLETVKLLNSHRSYQVAPVDAAAVEGQVKLAEAFHREGILPEAVEVRSAIKTWSGGQ